MSIPSIGQGDEIKASWLNQIVDKANGPEQPYDGQYYGTQKGYLIQKPVEGMERPEAQNPDTLFQTRVVPNCWQLTSYPFGYNTDGDPSENHIFINLGRSFQTLRSCIQVNGTPVDQIVLLPSPGNPAQLKPLVLSGPTELSGELSNDIWLPAEDSNISAVAETNTGWVDTGFIGDAPCGIYLVVAAHSNGQSDDPGSIAVITDIEARCPKEAGGVLDELENQGVVQLSDITDIPIAQPIGGWTLSAEWGDGNYGQNGAHVWNCYTVGTQNATIGQVPEDTMKPELKQKSVQRKYFTIPSDSDDPNEEGKTTGVLVRQLYNFNTLSSMDFPKLKADELSGLHWVLRLHKDDEEGGDEEEATKSLKKSKGLMKAGANEEEPDPDEGEGGKPTGMTRIVYSSVIHPDSFKGTNGISSLEYCNYSEADIEYSLFKFKDMDTVDYDPDNHDVLVRNHDGTLEYTKDISPAILGDASTDGADTKSIETIHQDEEAEDPGPRMHTFYRFKDLQYYREPVINFAADGEQHRLLDGLGIDIVVRDTENLEVAYLDPLYTLPDFDQLSDDIDDLSGAIDDIDDSLGELDNKINEISGDYWPKGKAYTECYGQSIGNGSACVIDLTHRVLMGNWEAEKDFTVGEHLFVTLSARLGDTLVEGDLKVTNDATVEGSLSVGGDLSCEGDFYLRNLNAMDITCDMLTVNEVSCFGDVDVMGILSSERIECISLNTEELEILSAFEVQCDAGFHGSWFEVDPAAQFNNDLYVSSGNIECAGSVQATLSVSSQVGSFDDVQINNDLVIGSTRLDEATLLDLLDLISNQRQMRAVPLENIKFKTAIMVDQPESQLSGT